ncbi:MAG TPA: class I SAM-dependent methyltransferase, partial [Thermodesulfovibrionales bacterium]|nr:class I SAM-dependent methyltransferase [Thermodesulfovibrionales bacterium]
MSANALRDNIQEILSPAGITINGSNPWDIRINDNRFYQRVLRDGSLGLGESYMDGWWDSQRLDDFFARILPTDPEEKMRKRWGLLIRIFGDAILHPGRKSRAFQIGERHYDKGNELFRAMLDKRMVYSCAYWKDAADLDAAQEAKLDLICRKINLRAGDRVMDVGCGWGGLVKYAAEKYGAKALGITVSKEQAALGGELCKGLPVEVRLLDYRDINEKFDHIFSVG